MLFALLPGTGLVLPGNAGVLRFGMTERQTQWTAATLANVRSDWWMCGARWCCSFSYEDIAVVAYACAGREEAGETLDHLLVERFERHPTEASRVQLALGDIDVFGFPVNELLEVLGPEDRAVLWPHGPAPQGTGYLRSVSLDACEQDRRR